jgi:hypothetical protein
MARFTSVLAGGSPVRSGSNAVNRKPTRPSKPRSEQGRLNRFCDAPSRVAETKRPFDVLVEWLYSEQIGVTEHQ